MEVSLTSGTKPKKAKKKTQRANSQNPSVSSVVYRGPSRIAREGGQNDLIVTQVNNSGTLTTTAGGQLTTVFDWYSQMSTPADWTQISNLWTEYRILSMEVEFIPWNTFNNASTTILAPVYSVVDRANNTVLGSVAAAVAYESCLALVPSTRFKRVVKMSSMEEAGWNAISSAPATASRAYLKMYSTGNTGSINLYDFVTRVIVQLRGRQ